MHGLARWEAGARDAVPLLIKALADRAPLTRRTAARTLGRIGPEARDAAPTLEKTARDPDPTVQRHARAALQQVRGM